MLTLFLIRHAKSSWKDSTLSDKARPLNKRGKNDAPLIGKILNEKKEYADLMISSPAKRALKTAEKIAEETGYKVKNIELSDKLYFAGYKDFIDEIRKIPVNNMTVFLFSHNPGITEFANEISGSDIENIPTCGAVKINFDMKSWKDIGETSGKQEYFIYPKMFKKSLS
jgi:phosphohistidine phosphatase